MNDRGPGGPSADPSSLQSIATEAAFIGALMLDNGLIGKLSHMIEKADFAEPLHGRIYRAILKLHGAGKAANPVTLRPFFEFDTALAEVGGAAYFAQLTGSGASVVGAKDFAQQIRDLARLRDVRDSVQRGLEAIGDDVDLAAFLAEVEQATARASTTMRTLDVLSSEQLIGLAADRVDHSLEHGVPGASCKTIGDMDTLLGKLEPGQMTILAGRPGMGKSTVGLSAWLGYGMNGHPGLYALAESSAEMFGLKHTADLMHAAGTPCLFKSLKEGILSRQQRADLARAQEIGATLPLKFVHIGRSDIKMLGAVVAGEVNRLKRLGKKLEVVVVDYLQLLTAEGQHRPGDDRGRINAISEGLLVMAQHYDFHMIALSQLSRAVEQRVDKRPHMADLRDSGRLEEDADNVLMVFREEYYLERDKPKDPKELADWEIDMAASRGKVELLAAKTRFGSVASRKCNFLGDFSAVRGSSWHGIATIGDDEDDLFDSFGGGGGR